MSNVKESEVLITLKERKEMPFIMLGDQIKYKVVDMDKAVALLREGRKKKGLTDQIELKVIKADRFKELQRGPTWVKDHVTGIYYGIPYGIYPDGNIKFQRILLGDYNSFNLANEAEAKFWIVMRMHPTVSGSPFEREAIFEVTDPELEAKKTISRATMIGNCISRATRMKKEDLLRFARYAGLPIPADPTVRIIRSMITGLAFENPERFQELYDSPIRGVAEAYHSGKQLGIIVEHPERGFSYEGIGLGLTDAEAFRFLEQDTVTLSRIQRSVAASEIDILPNTGDDEEEEKV